MLWGWAVAQYPVMLPGLTVLAAAGDPTVLRTVLWVIGIGSVVLVPSVLYLFAMFQRERGTPRSAATDGHR